MLAATIAVEAVFVLSVWRPKIPPNAVDFGIGGAYKPGSLKSGCNTDRGQGVL
jgi:hypothetical protein